MSFVDPSGNAATATAIVFGVAASILFNPGIANAPTSPTDIYRVSTLQYILGEISSVSMGVGVGIKCGVAAARAKAANAAKSAVAPAEGQAVTEGTYKFVASSGKPYVGSSKRIPARIQEHVGEGRVGEEAAAETVTREIKGGKWAREVEEQKWIDELGGIKNLENKRNPIGPKRRDHYNWEISKQKDIRQIDDADLREK